MSLSAVLGALFLMVRVFVIDADDTMSASECASYLCSKYSQEATKFIAQGCSGNFEDFVTTKTETEAIVYSDTSMISIKSLVLLAIMMFVVSFTLGIFVSKLDALPSNSDLATEIHNKREFEKNFGRH